MQAQVIRTHASLPPPRFCLLDRLTEDHRERWNASLLAARDHLWSFIAHDRDRGKSMLPGMAGKAPQHSPCPLGFEQQLAADWVCLMSRNQNALNVTAAPHTVRSVSLFLEWFQFSPGKRVNNNAPTSNHGACASYEGVQRCACSKRLAAAGLHSQCFLSSVQDALPPLSPAAVNHRTLILAGNDKPWLSEVMRTRGRNRRHRSQALVRAATHFDRIFFEAHDVRLLPGLVWGYPKAMSMHYMLGRETGFIKAALAARLDTKLPRALAAWGNRYSDNTSYQRSWNAGDAQQLEALAQDLAGVDRAMIPPGRSCVERAMIPPDRYLERLAQYRFLIAPHGRGIVSPKFMEAIMMMTIPITKRFAAFEEHRTYGLPIVVVGSWSEVTAANLDKWWVELSPELERARWAGTVEGYRSLLYERCTT